VAGVFGGGRRGPVRHLLRRLANVAKLRWSAVDLDRRLAWVHPDEAKARKAIPVPLNGEAVSILQKQIGKHRDIVFTFKGREIEQVSTAAWYKALRRAGIHNFRWQDPAAHVGKLARAGRNSAARAAGVGRLGELRHGPAVRALGRRAPGAVGRATQRSVG
jgi:integrase